MGVLVQHYFGFEVTIAGWSRTVENVHLHAARIAVIVHREIGVVETTAILRIRLHRIIANAPASEVVVLKISGCFGEPQFIQLVMHPVAPIEQLNHRRGAVISWPLARQIHGNIKYSKWLALRARK